MQSIRSAFREHIILTPWRWVVLCGGALSAVALYYAHGFLAAAAAVVAIFLIISPIRKRWLAYLASASTVLACVVLLLNNVVLADALLFGAFVWCVSLTGWLIAHIRHLPADEDRQPVMITDQWGIKDYVGRLFAFAASLDNSQAYFVNRSVLVLFYLFNVLVVSVYLFIFGIELPSSGTSVGFSGFFMVLVVGNALLWWYDHRPRHS